MSLIESALNEPDKVKSTAGKGIGEAIFILKRCKNFSNPEILAWLADRLGKEWVANKNSAYIAQSVSVFQQRHPELAKHYLNTFLPGKKLNDPGEPQ